MKKYIILLFAVICLFSACQKEQTIELLDKPIVQRNDDNTTSYTFTAVIANDLTDVDTKATIGRDGAYTWAEGDALRFYKDDATYDTAVVTAVAGSTATIQVTSAGSRSDYVYAVYPATAGAGTEAVEEIPAQPYKINFNVRGPIVVADVTQSGTLQFHHIGSLINIKFTSIPSDTRSLVFKPASAFGYDGTFSFTEGVPSLTSGGSTAEIVVPVTPQVGETANDEGNDITICVPTVSLAVGFSAALNNATDGSGRNLFKKTATTARDLTVGGTSSHTLLNMKSVACVAATKFYVKTYSDGTGWDCSGVRLIQAGSNYYETLMNTNASTTYYIYDEFNYDNPTTGYLSSGTLGDKRLYKFSWNGTSGNCEYMKDETARPWKWGSSAVDNMCICGSFNSWADIEFTYNGNQYWSYETGITLTKDTEYKFKFRLIGSWDNAWAKANVSCVNPGSTQLYGKATHNSTADNTDMTITVSETGTYAIYANALSLDYSDNPMQFMFEKK